MPTAPSGRRRLLLADALAPIINLVVVAVAISHALAADEAPSRLVETPVLVGRVDDGTLPPVAKRVPSVPLIVDPRVHGGTLGRHGGRMRWLMGNQNDLRMTVYYGYARLVGYDRDYRIVPDILADVTVEQQRIFTLHLRPGHRWSDGHPFTAEDFRYAWEDVANDPEFRRAIPPAMLVNGKPPIFEVLDTTTVRYTWDGPNPEFLPALAATLPLQIALPAHHLKKYHPRLGDPAQLEAMVKAAGVRNAAALHTRKMRMARAEDPELPVLDPWVNTTEPPSSAFTFARNPYYHRIDPEGRQLPYIDEIVILIGSSSLIPAKTGAGDSDLQARYLRFDDYTFLKAAERRGVINVKLWENAKGSHIAIVPNLTTSDPVWRTIVRDARFRRALSLGINRAEINAATFYGLARKSADTILPQSPLFRQAYADAFARYDPAAANQLLDSMGLDRRSYDGIRLLPDGRRAEIILETAGESTEQTDVLALIKDTWRSIGIAIFPRATQRDLFRQRIYSGQTIMSVWGGLNNALPNADTSPAELVPTAQAQLQWPAWGLYVETSGKQGERPDLPHAERLVDLMKAWRSTVSSAERAAIWHEILAVHAEQVFTIGVVNGTRQPVATSPRLQNVPQDGIFAYEPGGFFGIYQPDTFWLVPDDVAAGTRLP
ncbi:MAG: ABC transporter substrate-binding protein [Hyphomicrobiaceae bacterium]